MENSAVRKLLNTLYVTDPELYLGRDGEAIAVRKNEKVSLKLPLHNIENIICFTYVGISPSLMGACAKRNVGMVFLSPGGRFLARVSGPKQGNVLLRKKQYGLSQDKAGSTAIASSFVLAKVQNSRQVINRALRDHALVVDVSALEKASDALKEMLPGIRDADNVSDLLGYEGRAARTYFNVLDHLVLRQKRAFYFRSRTRRPPMDNLNALLSYLYTVLTYEVASALEAVGLDTQVGFLHQVRPGRPSLALDLAEELRAVFVDRLVLSVINRQEVKGSGFLKKESGGVIMDDSTKKKVLTAWQERKKNEITHPFLNERIPFGLVPHVQALLLSRYLRGDLDAYPPYFWR